MISAAPGGSVGIPCMGDTSLGERRLERELTTNPAMFNNVFRTAALMAALITLFGLIGYALGGSTGLLVAFVVAVVMNVGSYWFSDKIVLKMQNGREVTEAEAPELVGMVDRLRQRAGLPMPRVCIIPTQQPNAFATGRNPEHAVVAFTEGIMQALSMEELEGVAAHELAHIKNRDILTSSIAATVGSAITLLARFAIFVPSGNNRGGGLQNLLLLILAPIAAMLIQMAISRSREFAADRDGAEIAGSPDGLADALLRMQHGAEALPADRANPSTAHLFIVNPLGGRAASGIRGLFRTHPPTDERVRRLRAMAPGTSSRS